jgi:hypothetical protein
MSLSMDDYWGVGTVVKSFEWRLRDERTIRHVAQQAVRLMTCET